MMSASKYFIAFMFLTLAYICIAQSTKSAVTESVTRSSSTEQCKDGLGIKLKFSNEPLENTLITIGEGIKTSIDAVKALETDVEVAGCESLYVAKTAIFNAELILKNITFTTPEDLEIALDQVKGNLSVAAKAVVELSAEKITYVNTKATVNILIKLVPALESAVNDIKDAVDCPCSKHVTSSTVKMALTTKKPSRRFFFSAKLSDNF